MHPDEPVLLNTSTQRRDALAVGAPELTALTGQHLVLVDSGRRTSSLLHVQHWSDRAGARRLPAPCSSPISSISESATAADPEQPWFRAQGRPSACSPSASTGRPPGRVPHDSSSGPRDRFRLERAATRASAWATKRVRKRTARQTARASAFGRPAARSRTLAFNGVEQVGAFRCADPTRGALTRQRPELPALCRGLRACPSAKTTTNIARRMPATATIAIRPMKASRRLPGPHG